MRLLDLFCGAGGAAMGYHRAGFEVVGVDVEPQPNYPFRFIKDDVRGLYRGYVAGSGDVAWLEGFDAVHASPPCQAFSVATRFHPGASETHPDLVEPTRRLLGKSGLPYIIENVPGAPIRHDVLLCGEMFGLGVHRHRYFELGNGAFCMQHPHQPLHLKGALDNCHIEDGFTRQVAGNFADLKSASEAMGIDWMTRDELREAIPPAYTEFIGNQLMVQLMKQAA